MKSSPVNAEVSAFLRPEKVVLVEPSIPFAQSLIGYLKEIGAQDENIFHARRYADAVELIKTHKPKILITEYGLGTSNGISLIPLQLEYMEETTKIAVLITHDTASTTIAEAAEEHVDAYILKPFSIGDFADRFNKLILSRTQATPYQLKLRAGKAYLKEKNFDKAIGEFLEAMAFHQRPALAHFYVGRALHLQNSAQKASTHYQQGLDINPLHYKCLLGEFDSHFDQKNYAEAYEVAKKITKNFPISPKRLGNVFISLVFSHHLEDITTYYDIYRHLDPRPPELTKIFAAALSTAGKSYLKKNEIAKANECFHMGVNVIGPEVTYLDSVIRELIKAKATHLAHEYLAIYPALEIGKKSHAQASFLIDINSATDRDMILEKGKKLVAQGFADKGCYSNFVKFLMDVNKKTMAEDIATKAIKEFPDLRTELYSMIEEQPAQG